MTYPHPDDLPLHERDQIGALLRNANDIHTTLAERPDLAEGHTDPEKLLKFFDEVVGLKSAFSVCEHLNLRPTQMGIWTPGYPNHRYNLNCNKCTAVLLHDTDTVNQYLNDDHCDLCQQPTTVFHTVVIQIPFPNPHGTVTMLCLIAEACPQCDSVLH